MPNILYIAIVAAALEAALNALYNTEGITELSDTAGEAAVLTAITGNGDLVAVLTANNILSQVVTYLWQLIKRVQAKVKSWLDHLADIIQELLNGRTVEWTVAPAGGAGE